MAVCISEDDENDSENMYEIFIGCWGGGESGIRRGRGDDVLRVETPDILSPDEFRSFWIKINRGVVKVPFYFGEHRPLVLNRICFIGW